MRCTTPLPNMVFLFLKFILNIESWIEDGARGLRPAEGGFRGWGRGWSAVGSMASRRRGEYRIRTGKIRYRISRLYAG